MNDTISTKSSNLKGSGALLLQVSWRKEKSFSLPMRNQAKNCMFGFAGPPPHLTPKARLEHLQEAARHRDEEVQRIRSENDVLRARATELQAQLQASTSKLVLRHPPPVSKEQDSLRSQANSSDDLLQQQLSLAEGQPDVSICTDPSERALRFQKDAEEAHVRVCSLEERLRSAEGLISKIEVERDDLRTQSTKTSAALAQLQEGSERASQEANARVKELVRRGG